MFISPLNLLLRESTINIYIDCKRNTFTSLIDCNLYIEILFRHGEYDKYKQLIPSFYTSQLLLFTRLIVNFSSWSQLADTMTISHCKHNVKVFIFIVCLYIRKSRNFHMSESDYLAQLYVHEASHWLIQCHTNSLLHNCLVLLHTVSTIRS